MPETLPLPQESIVGRSIGQREPLTVRLRNLIRGYPKGLGIIKEFLQNADDAGATRVEVILDWRSQPTERLPCRSMARLAGPALLVVNNATFTDDDFKGILSLGESGKRFESAKLGKFGLGFNAAYNITDYPCLVSRNQIYVFDPNRSAVGELSSEFGLAYELSEGLWNAFPDMLFPFAAGGLQHGQVDLGATIFRLPLRTVEHAADSAITSEQFTESDFDDILAQLSARASDLLLFLQHVLVFSVSIVDAEGRRSTVLEVVTANDEEVLQARSRVGRWLSGEHAGTLAALKSSEESLVTSFNHRMLVRSLGTVSEAEWLVVNGLHAGTDGKLHQLADAMVAEGEKALPLAGAAVRLTSGEDGNVRIQPVEGMVYCGLPLPRRTTLALHVNGYFELDASREWLWMNAESVGTSERQRQHWNRELLNHGVAHAVSILLASLVDKVDSSQTGRLYELWPRTDRAMDDLLPGFGASVYRHLFDARKEVIRIENPTEGWIAPGDVILLPDEWRRPLLAPLAAGGWKVPVPALPTHALVGFAAAQHPLPELTPKKLRDAWRVNKDVNVAVENAPNLAWRTKEWVVSLLSFVLSDGSQHLSGVPLALLCDGRLHTFGHSLGGSTFIGSDVQRAIFAAYPHWFVDPELVERCSLPEIPTAKLKRLSALEVLLNLNKVLKVDQDNVPWDPTGSGLPNAGWLTAVFQYLADDKALASEQSADGFKKLALVPDQLGRLHRPGTTGTPLWPLRKREKAKELAPVLGAFRVPVVTGPDRLCKALQGALDTSQSDLVWEMTGPDLVDVMHDTREAWGNETASYSPAIHGGLLDFLASEEADAYSDEQINRLRELPVFPTRDHDLVCITDENVFVPGEGSLPTPPSQARLLKVGHGSWRKLLKRAGARELDGSALLESILDADFALLSEKRRTELLKWVRENLDRLLAALVPNERERMLARVGAARLILGDDGELHSAAELYDPAVTDAREILGRAAVVPDFGEAMSSEVDLWLAFFRRLGMASTLRPADLTAYIDDLVGRYPSDGDATVDDTLLRVFDYVRNHWSLVAEQNVHDGNNRTLRDALQNRAWLPAQRKADRLTAFAGAVIPEDRLFRPDELFQPNQGHLVASQAPIAAFQKTLPKDVQEGLGFPRIPRLSTVVSHFEHLLDLWESPNHGGLRPERLAKSLGSIYRELGNRLARAESPDETAADDDIDTFADLSLSEVQSRFAERACLWDERRGRFWFPRHTFRTQANFFGERRAQLALAEHQADAGYDVLGRHESPGAADLVAFLNEVATDFGNTALTDVECANVLHSLKVLTEQGAQTQAPDEPIPLLTRDRRLVQSVDVFDDDDPHHIDSIPADSVSIVHPDVPLTLRIRLGIPSLARSLHEQLVESPERTSDPSAVGFCAKMQGTLRSPEFAAGLRRFVVHRHGTFNVGDQSWLGRVEVLPVLPFRTEIWLQHNEIRRSVGPGEASFFLDVKDDCVYLSVDTLDLAETLIAQAIETRLGPLGDLSPLAAMLRVPPVRISGLLTRLGIREVRDESSYMVDGSTDESPLPMEFADVDEQLDFLPAAPLEDDNVSSYGELNSDADVESHSPSATGSGHSGEDASLETETVYSGGAPESDTMPNDTTDRERRLVGNADDGAETRGPTGRVAEGLPGTRGPSTRAAAGTPPGRERVEAERPTMAADNQEHGQSGSGVSAPDSEPGGAARSRTPRSTPAFNSSTERRRVVTYLIPARSDNPDHDEMDDEHPANLAIGWAAEEFAAEEERRAGRRVTRMPHNNPGYDILSEGSTENERRLIEVKGIAGEWGANGVPLSARQYATGWRERDAYWLYVVEYAEDPSRRRLTCIQDPVGHVSQYRVDHGWRALGSNVFETSGPILRYGRPQVGNSVRLDDGRDGRIANVIGLGELVRIVVEFPDGLRQEMLFKPGSMSIRP